MSTEERLLLITNRYPAGPNDTASPFVYDFRMALKRLGTDVDIVTPSYNSYSDESLYIDKSVHTFEWSDGRRVISQLPLYNPASYIKIRRYFLNGLKSGADLLERKNYDAILALWAAPSGYIAYKLSQEYCIPYAVWALGSDINSWAKLPFVGGIILRVLKNADMLYADGYGLAMKVQSLSERSCRFIPSYHAVDIEQAINDNPDRQFICVGRVEKSKGVFDLLEAFRLFLKDFPDWKLQYVGTGMAENKLKHLIESYRLKDSIVCHGYLTRAEVNRLLCQSVAAIIPSHSDSLPLTFGEALQAGVPLICSDVGDMPYFIEKYKVGCHYHVGHIDELLESMKIAVQKHNSLAANCPRALAELDISNSARAVVEWMKSLKINQKSMEFAHADS